MISLLPDTNVWIGVGRAPDISLKLETISKNGGKIVIAPPSLIELVRGMVRHGKETFADDKKTYVWMADHRCEVLELTRPFMAHVLKAELPKNSGVVPAHYEQLIAMVGASANLDEFLERCNAKNSVWNKMEQLDVIHEAQIDKELTALEGMARQDKDFDISEALSKTFQIGGAPADAALIGNHFSAAIEYLQSSIRKLDQGANLRKNDRGAYMDWQLLMYLAIPEVVFVTNENFSSEITKSPQKNRIIKPNSIP
jgi:hypothetical protein